MNSFRGLGVAVITPFDRNLAVDFEALQRVLDHLYSKNAPDYLVVLGSTGEATTLSDDEKKEVLKFFAEYNQERIPLMLGHGGSNTQALIRSIKKFELSGFSGILSSSPAYVKPTQEGIYKHYTALADNLPLPIMLYNVPSRTGSNINADTVVRLSTHQNIMGIKDASADIIQAMELRERVADDFLLISGDDMFTVPLCSVGFDGLISVLGNAYPEIYKETLNACFDANFKAAARLARKTLKINGLMYKEGNPVGIKQLMAHLGLCEPFVRLPLSPATEELSTEIKAALL